MSGRQKKIGTWLFYYNIYYYIASNLAKSYLSVNNWMELNWIEKPDVSYHVNNSKTFFLSNNNNNDNNVLVFQNVMMTLYWQRHNEGVEHKYFYKLDDAAMTMNRKTTMMKYNSRICITEVKASHFTKFHALLSTKKICYARCFCQVLISKDSGCTYWCIEGIKV